MQSQHCDERAWEMHKRAGYIAPRPFADSSAAARELLEIANTIDCPRHASSCRQWLPTRRYLDDRRPLCPTFDIAESNKLSDYRSNKSFCGANPPEWKVPSSDEESNERREDFLRGFGDQRAGLCPLSGTNCDG